MSYLNAHHSGRYIVRFCEHRGYCRQCFSLDASAVIQTPGAFCDIGRALAQEWVTRFELEAPEGSTYKLGQPVGSQPYVMMDRD